MKAVKAIFFAVVLGVLTSGCGAAGPPPGSPIKGYELYSWQGGDQWNFSVLVGTNREKTLSEIRSAGTALAGLEALKSTLETIPAGQTITWISKENLAFPPDDLIRQIVQFCQDRGLDLNISR